MSYRLVTCTQAKRKNDKFANVTTIFYIVIVPTLCVLLVTSVLVLRYGSIFHAICVPVLLVPPVA
jgi:hypothetical protein